MIKKALITFIAAISIIAATVPTFASTRAYWEWNEKTQRYEFTLYDDDCNEDGVCLDPNWRQIMEEESQKDSFDLPDWARNI